MHRATTDGRATGDHTVGGHLGGVHAEQGGAVLAEGADLVEGVGVYQVVDTLASGLLALGTLFVEPSLATAKFNAVPLVGQLLNTTFHRAGELDCLLLSHDGRLPHADSTVTSWLRPPTVTV